MNKRQQKCAKCQQALIYFTLVLWNGPNGFRRYALCDKCKAEHESHEMTRKTRKSWQARTGGG